MTSEPRLAAFLADLATDSERLAIVATNATAAQRLMDAAGLTSDEQYAVRSGDMSVVFNALASQAGETNQVWAAPVKDRPGTSSPAPGGPPSKSGPSSPGKPGGTPKPPRDDDK